MSRRKQSHPKSIKDSGSDETEDICRNSNFPSHILHLRELADVTGPKQERLYSVHSISTILEGSQFGPFSCCVLDAENVDASKEDGCLIKFPLSLDSGARDILISIESAAGHWVKLLRKTVDEQESNIQVSILGGNTLWLQVKRNVTPDTELVMMMMTSPQTERLTETPQAPMETEASRCIRETSPPTPHDYGSSPDEKMVKVVEKDQEHSFVVVRPKERKTPLHAATDCELLPRKTTFSLVHICMFCGVKFSSPRTLQAHVTNYCSKKPFIDVTAHPSLYPTPYSQEPLMSCHMTAEGFDHDGKRQKRALDEDVGEFRSSEKIVCKAERASSVSSGACADRFSGDGLETSGSISNSAPGTNCKNPRFKCVYCSFATDEELGIIHHSRVHYQSGNIDSNLVDWLSARNLYCADCNIKFSSFSTYSGHKKLYCRQRHRNNKDGISGSSINSSAGEQPSSNTTHHFTQTLFPPSISPRLPIFPSGSSIFPSHLFSSPGHPISAGLAQAIFLSAAPFLASHVGFPSIPFDFPANMRPVISPEMSRGAFGSENGVLKEQTSSKESSPEVLNHKRRCSTSSSEETPLDLRTKSTDDVIKSPRTHSEIFEPNETLTIIPPRFKLSPGAFMRSPSLILPSSFNGNSPLLPPPVSAISPQASEPGQPSMTPVSQSMSKCLECNIVFYKHENYVAHKEHYCAGRQTQLHGPGPAATHGKGKAPAVPQILVQDCNGKKSSAELIQTKNEIVSGLGHNRAESSDAVRRGKTAVLSPRAKTPELIATIDQGVLQYYCIPCKIKFSNLDTLKAHKQYYCPARLTNMPPTSPPPHSTKATGSSNGENEGGSLSSCKTCGNKFASAELMKLHYCTGSLAHYPLFHCPYCDYIAQSDGRLVDHIKAHAPSKAYKCIMCGYRGNTVRGMRMHGKMHSDAGEPFTDDSMVEYEEPPTIPKRLRLTAEGAAGVGDVEAELIRIKNEPYKRRRSRKAYEKSEFSIAAVGVRCLECGAGLPDASSLQMHMQGHVAEKVIAWKAFSSNAMSLDEMKQIQARLYPSFMKDGECRSGEIQDGRLKKDDAVSKEELREDCGAEGSQMNGARSTTPIVTVKEEYLDVEENGEEEELGETGSDKNSPTPGNLKTVTQPDLVECKVKTVNNNIVAADSTEVVKIKEEALNDSTSETNQILSDDNTQTKSNRIVNCGSCSSGLRSIDNKSPSSTIVEKNEENTETVSGGSVRENDMDKYCQQCNISFLYFSTFVAHKKYYCSSHATERLLVKSQSVAI